MFMTVLEAHIESAQWATLSEGFEKAQAQRPPQIVESMLAQSQEDPTLWRSIAIWPSKEAFDAFRQLGITSPAILVFRAAGGEPTLGTFQLTAFHLQGQ